MPNPVAVVVGAGPTGMTAAIELKRAGLEVRIIDKSSHLAEHSQALVVQARTLEQFQRYGLVERAVARGRRISAARFFSEGKQILHFSLNRIPSRYPYALLLPQDETEALLNSCMESLGVRTERQVEMVALTLPSSEVRAILRHSDGRLEDVFPRWVIGCDGAHSTIRQLTGTPFQGRGVGLTFFLGDLELDGPDAPVDELAIHLHHGDVVFMVRLSDRLVRVIVASHAKGGEQQRQLAIEDFQRAADRAGVRITVRGAAWMTPFRVNDLQAKHYRVRGAFLAGDASHIHSPVGGQGMNTGIQDVANLAWKLAAVARGASDTLLDSYEEERAAVGRTLLRFTERGLGLATSSSSIVEMLRDALAPLLSKLGPVQHAAVGFISETAIDYRSSSIVTDQGGDGQLRAGDRMPDLILGSGPNATALLRHWTTPGHLAIFVAQSASARERFRIAVPSTEVRDVQVADMDDEALRQLGLGPKLILVRPDGYIGYRGSADGDSGWKPYARRMALL